MVSTALPVLWFQWQLASDMLNAMDTKVDPCVDFYEYACGSYAKNTIIPNDKGQVGSTSRMQDRLMEQLRASLESKLDDGSVSGQYAKLYYKACVNTDALESVGLTKLKETIQRFGGWQILQGPNWNGSRFDWIDNTARIKFDTGISPIILFEIRPDFANSTRYMLKIDQPNLGLGKRDYYVDKNNTKGIEAYKKFLAATAVQLGADNATANEEAAEAVDFETALAVISVREEDRRDNAKKYKPMAISDLRRQYPKINFQTWFDYAASRGLRLDDSTIVNVAGAQYLDNLPEVLSNFSGRTVSNYLMWMLVKHLVDYLAPSLRENSRVFNQAVQGTPDFPQKWRDCLMNDMLRYLKWPLSSIYIKNYFNSEHKGMVDNMVGNIRKVMAPTIENATWMDEGTKQHALEKLSAIISNMAYPPDEIFNETWLMRDFDQARLSEDRYMENYLSISESIERRLIADYYHPINRTQWNSIPPAMVNAQYTPSENKMTFPAGILSYPFFSPQAPAYVNYPRIGIVMGHELTHGYDDQGRQYDAQGNYILWWTNDTLANFKKRAICFVNQYGSIVEKVTGQHLNGENTQGENIADNGGIKLAFKAYNLWKESTPDNSGLEILPGFSNYTQEQLFFLAYAQNFCQAIRDQTLRVNIIRDPHAPNKYRANIPLQNNADFATAYQCPVGSPMNPKEKCAVW